MPELDEAWVFYGQVFAAGKAPIGCGERCFPVPGRRERLV